LSRDLRADRLKVLPPYLFAEVDRAKREAIQRGVDVIDLGVGDPDMPTPGPIVEALREAAGDPACHRYPSYAGWTGLRETFAAYFQRRFGVKLDPGKEVLALIGSKEGIANTPLALLNPGEVALVPEPAYPVYRTSTIFAGGEPWEMPLLEKNGFFPDLGAIPADVLDRARLMFINYPNNPTAATASTEQLGRAVEFARKHEVVICHDAAYAETYFGDPPPSILSVPGGREVAIEYHSLSKTFSMAGWRIGFAVGRADALAALLTLKSNVDSGAFIAVQRAAAVALENAEALAGPLRERYRARLEILAGGLEAAGAPLRRPEATFYLWVRVPKGSNSMGFAKRLLDEAGVVATPGVGFGKSGEGFVRMSLTAPEERLEVAAERLSRMRWR